MADLEITEVHSDGTSHTAPRPVEGVAKVLASVAGQLADEGVSHWGKQELVGITFRMKRDDA